MKAKTLLSLLLVGIAACSSTQNPLDKVFTDRLGKGGVSDLSSTIERIGFPDLLTYYQDLRSTDKAHADILSQLSYYLKERGHDDKLIDKVSKAFNEGDFDTLDVMLYKIDGGPHGKMANNIRSSVSADTRRRVFAAALEDNLDIAFNISLHDLVDDLDLYDSLSEWVKLDHSSEVLGRMGETAINHLYWHHREIQRNLANLITGFKEASPSKLSLYSLSLEEENLRDYLEGALQSVSNEEAQKFLNVLATRYYDRDHDLPEWYYDEEIGAVFDKIGYKNANIVKRALKDRLAGREPSRKPFVPKKPTRKVVQGAEPQTEATA